jgi:hypothetical protein
MNNACQITARSANSQLVYGHERWRRASSASAQAAGCGGRHGGFHSAQQAQERARNARKIPQARWISKPLRPASRPRGILRNLVVEPELDADGQPIGFSFVTIGKGRRLAKMLRVKRKEIRKTEANSLLRGAACQALVRRPMYLVVSSYVA